MNDGHVLVVLSFLPSMSDAERYALQLHPLLHPLPGMVLTSTGFNLR